MIGKSVVVTGANGFIGQHLCRKLAESGREVTACIRERADEAVFGDHSGFLKVFRLSSLGLEADLSPVLRNAEAVIHLAGRAHVMRETAKNPLSEFRVVNVRGTENVASIAARSGVKRFIYLSSIKVNGEVTEGRAFQADDQPGYCDPYGQSKWEAEERLQEIAAGTTMEWAIVRPPLVYGPGVRGNFLALMNWVFRRIPLPFGSLHNSRSLVSVYNLSDLLCLLVDHPGAANRRFVVSDPEDISTPELVRRIAAALHRSPRILRCPKSALEMAGTLLGQKAAVQRLCSSLVLDRRKTSETLGWSAPLSLEWGLDRTAEWFLKRTTGQ
jgi:nucleoside-diphosphate-sugar epimerase